MNGTPRSRARDVRAEVLSGVRGADSKRALTLEDVDGVLGPAIRAYLAREIIRPGMIVLHAGSPGVGWLEADGADVLREGYPALFRAIGVTYGPGDGSTTFTLPTVAAISGLSAYIKT